MAHAARVLRVAEEAPCAGAAGAACGVPAAEPLFGEGPPFGAEALVAAASREQVPLHAAFHAAEAIPSGGVPHVRAWTSRCGGTSRAELLHAVLPVAVASLLWGAACCGTVCCAPHPAQARLAEATLESPAAAAASALALRLRCAPPGTPTGRATGRGFFPHHPRLNAYRTQAPKAAPRLEHHPGQPPRR